MTDKPAIFVVKKIKEKNLKGYLYLKGSEETITIDNSQFASEILNSTKFEISPFLRFKLEDLKYRLEKREKWIGNPTRKKGKKNKKGRTTAIQQPKSTLPPRKIKPTPASGPSKKTIPLGLRIISLTTNKVVTIKVDKEEFHSFEDAIEYVNTTDHLKNERLKVLKEKRDDWYMQIWIPRLGKIIGEYEQDAIEFTELFSRMNDRYNKDFSEAEALHILSLCASTVRCITEKGADGNKLSEKRSYSLVKQEPKTRELQKHPTLPQPQAKDTEDNDPLFKSEYRRLIGSHLSKESQDIYIGLDFGTSFTKAAYQYTPGDRGVILFGNSPFKPTVVYYSEKTGNLSFFRTSEEYRQIQFFKATMVKDKEQYSELRYNNVILPSREIHENFEMLCSVFFIANTLLFIRHKLNEVFPFNPNLYVAMGVPLFGSTDIQPIYNEALNAGLYIANTVSDPSEMQIEELYKLYSDARNQFNNDWFTGVPYRIQHCTIPELFTEALYLLNRKTFAPGFYYIVDIGGGTSDFAFINKEDNSSATGFDYYCPSAVVAKLGNEVRKACESSISDSQNYLNEFGLKYRTTIAKGKFGLNLHGPMEITQLLFGGGAVDPSGYYQKRKTSFTNGLHSISCIVNSRNDQDYSNPFIPSELGLSKEDMQRLIIATQLAIPETSESYLKGRPESYDHSPKPQKHVVDIEDRYPADRIN